MSAIRVTEQQLDQLEFLRELEQDVNRLQTRIREGYSGLPELIAVKHKINQQIIGVLESRTRRGYKMTETTDTDDLEFEQLWETVDAIWRQGDKRDAKFFWLQGRQLEIEKRQAELARLQDEVASAR